MKISPKAKQELKIIFILLLFLFAILIVVIRAISCNIKFNKYITDEKYTNYYVLIRSIKSIEKDKITYLAYISSENNANEKNSILTFKDLVYVNVYNGEYTYNCLNILKVNAKFLKSKKMNNEGEFDYDMYLKSKNICGTLNVYNVDFEGNHNISIVEKRKYVMPIYMHVIHLMENFKEVIACNIDKVLDKNTGGLLKGIIYGDTKDIDSTTKEAFEQVGISHLTAVSGENVATVIAVLCVVIDKITIIPSIRKKIKHNRQTLWYKELIKCVIALLFMVIASFELSIVRAVLMVIISSITIKVTKRNPNTYHSLFASMYLILAYNPYSLFNTGLQLSFLATLSIMLFENKIENSLFKLLKLEKKQKCILVKIVCKVVKIIATIFSVTMSAQILLLPVQLNSFKAYPYVIFISNIIASMLDTPIRILGVTAVYLSFLPHVSIILIYVAGLFVKLLIISMIFLASITSAITVMTLPTILWYIYYFVILLLYVYSSLKNKKSKEKLKKVKVAIITMVSIFLIILLVVLLHNKYISAYAYFFNVGQGQMTLIVDKENTVLVDCGSTVKNMAYNVLDGYLKSKNIQKIDALFITHFHSDHVNGIVDLLNEYEVKNVYYTKPIEVNEEYIQVSKAIKETNTSFNTVYKAEKIVVGGITVEILFPNNNEIIEDKDKVNANSMVSLSEVNNKKILFMGDATVKTENLLLTEEKISNIHVLQVGHHGSSTSTSQSFIQKVSPYIAVVSSKQSVYGHPSKVVIDRLSVYATYVYVLENTGGLKVCL